jgi:hypothetical protein
LRFAILDVSGGPTGFGVELLATEYHISKLIPEFKRMSLRSHPPALAKQPQLYCYDLPFSPPSGDTGRFWLMQSVFQ